MIVPGATLYANNNYIVSIKLLQICTSKYVPMTSDKE